MRPVVVEVENAGSKLTVARRYQSPWLLESGEQKMDAGVDADEEWLGGERGGAAVRAVFIEVAGVPIASLCGENFRLEIHNLLLFLGSWPRPVPLRVADGGVHGLVRQIGQERVRVVAVDDFRGAGGRRGFPPIEHYRAQERQVGGRQWPAIHRDDVGCIAPVLVVDANDLVVRGCGNSDSDADQAPGEQQAVGLAPLPRVWKHPPWGSSRRQPGGRWGPCREWHRNELDVRRGHGQGVAGLVASDAAAAVGAKVLEEGIRRGVGGPAKIQIREAAVRIREFLKTPARFGN